LIVSGLRVLPFVIGGLEIDVENVNSELILTLLLMRAGLDSVHRRFSSTE